MTKKNIIIICAICLVIASVCLVFFCFIKDNSVPTNSNDTINNSIENVANNTINNEIDNTIISNEENTIVPEKNTVQQPNKKPESNASNKNTITNTNSSSNSTENEGNISQDTENFTSNQPENPSTPSAPEVVITYYGDANEDKVLDIADASIIKMYLEGNKNLTGQALKNADINADGRVNNVDVVLIQGVLAKIYSHEITKPLTKYVLYGDSNDDGVIDISDVTIIRRYLEGSNTLTGQALKNADVNNDGNVDEEDATSVQKFLAGMHPNTLPYKPIV